MHDQVDPDGKAMPTLDVVPPGCIRLYHGTTSWRAHAIVSDRPRFPSLDPDAHDFGRGFYLTPSWEIAVSFAVESAWESGAKDDPAVIAFDIDQQALALHSRWIPSPKDWVQLVWSGCQNDYGQLAARSPETETKWRQSHIVEGPLNGTNNDLRANGGRFGAVHTGEVYNFEATEHVGSHRHITGVDFVHEVTSSAIGCVACCQLSFTP
jgi:hypothetical protein